MAKLSTYQPTAQDLARIRLVKVSRICVLLLLCVSVICLFTGKIGNWMFGIIQYLMPTDRGNFEEFSYFNIFDFLTYYMSYCFSCIVPALVFANIAKACSSRIRDIKNGKEYTDKRNAALERLWRMKQTKEAAASEKSGGGHDKCPSCNGFFWLIIGITIGAILF